MYFTAETQTSVLERFSFALHEHGLLMLGKAEMLLTQGQLFRPVDLGHRLFRKAVEPGRRRPVVTGGAVDVPQGDIGLRRVAQAAFTSWPTLNPASRIFDLNAEMSPSEGAWPAGTGSCQIRSSAGTSGPR